MHQSFFLFFFICAFNLHYLVPSSSATPIIGGLPDEHQDFKHHVSLHRTISRESDTYEYFCGGSIFAEKHVLTAASCFVDYSGLEITNLLERRPKIIAGTKRRDGPGIERYILRVYIPNAYGSGSRRNADISVVELSRGLDLSHNIYSMPSMRFFYLDPESDGGQAAIIPGFGATNTYGNPRTMAEISHYIVIVLRNRRDCPGDDSIICANSHANRVETACDGDIGGGLIVNGDIVGVLIYGPKNCDTNTEPILFTRIKTFSGFIQRATHSSGAHLGMRILYDRGVEGSSSGGRDTFHPRS